MIDREPESEAGEAAAPHDLPARHDDRRDERTLGAGVRVSSQQLGHIADGVRQVLAAAAGAEGEAAARLAAGLASDAGAAGMPELRDAAAALARCAEGGQPLGAPALAVARAHQAVRERLDRGSGPGSSP